MGWPAESGFLPHELDYTHLRMLWRRWKKKARIKFFGHSLRPFGPEWLDRTVSRILGLKGDFVFDFRLIDYLVSILSTDENPALDGIPGNDLRLKADLDAMGIFDHRMPLYMLLRLRQHHQIGFSGFEARHYSLFESFQNDMSAATNLQQLITILAYKYIFQRCVTHSDIPDNPTVESERRQIIFGTAIGVPTFYIHKNSTNRLMFEILKAAQNTRASRRYAGYIRIPGVEYRRALLCLLRRDGADLIEMLNLHAVVDDLEQRIENPREHATAQRLAQRICGTNKGRPLDMGGREFNLAAEDFYRNALKKQHLQEAFDCFRDAMHQLDSWQSWRSGCYNQPLMQILGGGIGRLACISFGCCYGKPLNQLPARLQKPLSRFCIVFHGKTKKAAYAHGLAGQKTLAVPCMTAILYCCAGLLGAYGFLEGHQPGAYLLCVLATQIWRFFSEFLRADYRGGGRISAYQYMALLAALASAGYYLALPVDDLRMDLITGLRNLWNPAIIIICLGLWIAIFLYMGRSRVTTAHISLFVRPDHN